MTDPKNPENAELAEPPPSSALRYLGVWAALVVLAVATLLIAQLDLGGWNLAIALAIATVKATLVLAYFMHLAHDRPLHRLLFAIALGFVVLLIVGVLADVGTRSIASPYVGERTVPSWDIVRASPGTPA